MLLDKAQMFSDTKSLQNEERKAKVNKLLKKSRPYSLEMIVKELGNKVKNCPISNMWALKRFCKKYDVVLFNPDRNKRNNYYVDMLDLIKKVKKASGPAR